MKPRLIVLILAAIAVIVATEFRVARHDPPQPTIATDEFPLAMAPSFAGYDSEMHLFRLKSYIGRHALFVVFCGENKEALKLPIVVQLMAHQDTIQSKGMQVIIVTTNLPQENRGIELPDGFELISDFEQSKTGQLFSAHNAFRSFDVINSVPRSSTFFIDRAGNVPVNAEGPVALVNPGKDIQSLLGIAETAGQ